MFKNKIIQFLGGLVVVTAFAFICYGAGITNGNWGGIFTGTAYINSGVLSNIVGFGNGANLTNIQETNIFSTIVTKTTSYNLTANDSVVILNAASLTATLPSAVGIAGYQYTIINNYSGSQTVATTSSQTINGSTTYTLSSQYNTVTVQSDGGNWWIINNH